MIRWLGPCGSFAPSSGSICEACGRRIRCVYVVDDGGWLFFMGRRCYQRLQTFLSLAVSS